MERREPRNPWFMLRCALNRGSGAGTYAPCRGFIFSRPITPGLRSDRSRGLRFIRGCQPAALPGS